MLTLVDRPRGFGQTNQTQLLLHCEGSAGGTTFTDSSQNAFTVTPTSATTSTTQAKFGSTSAYFGASAAAKLSIPDNSVLRANSGFTLDLWVYPTDATTFRFIWTKQNAGGYSPFLLYISSGQFYFTASADGTTWGLLAINTYSCGVPTINTWQHVAVQWTGSNWYGYKDGVQGFSVASGTAPMSTTDPVLIGGDGVSLGHKGYLDEMRFSTGAIFPTAGFTPPGNPYSTG